MTFEEINHNILAGIPCGSFDEAAESILLLSAGDRTIAHLLAVRLAESKRLWISEERAGSWVQYAVDTFRLENCNFIHHRQAVGEMLLALRDESSRIFRLMFELEITKVDALLAVFNAKEVVGLCNFVKLHPQLKSMKRDELRDKIAVYLDKEKAVKSEQLTLQLTFDVLGYQINDCQLAAITTSPDFDSYAAWTLSWNGTTLLKNALPTLELYADDFDIDDLEGMCADLAAASERITKILNLKKSNILG